MPKSLFIKVAGLTPKVYFFIEHLWWLFFEFIPNTKSMDIITGQRTITIFTARQFFFEFFKNHSYTHKDQMFFA